MREGKGIGVRRYEVEVEGEVKVVGMKEVDVDVGWS